MKKRFIVVTTISVLIITTMIIVYKFNEPVHRHITIEDLKEVEYWGSSSMVRRPNQAELEELVKWFNSIDDISPNRDFAGTTPESGIFIHLKTGKRILILNSGKDFEIQRDDVKSKNISYWGKQEDIKKLLKNIELME